MKSIFPILAVVCSAAVVAGCDSRFPDPVIFGNVKSVADIEAIERSRSVDTDNVSTRSLNHYDPYMRDVREVIYFDTAKSELSYEDKEVLDEMIARSETYTNYEFEVVGHTDRHGKEADNQGLSETRGYAVVQYLMKNGVPSHRLIMRAHSERKPAVLGVTKYGDAKNRRVVVSLRSAD